MSNRIYTTIYQLKGINSFSEIEKWCKKEFNSPVKHSKRHQEEFNKLSANERFYKYKWIYFSQIQTLPIVIGGNDISFIEARAEIEYAKRKIFDNNQYLPKKDRLNTEDIDVIFFELDKNFYVVIQTSNINQIGRILNLIGTEYIKGQAFLQNHPIFKRGKVWRIFTRKNGRTAWKKCSFPSTPVNPFPRAAGCGRKPRAICARISSATGTGSFTARRFCV